HRFAGADIKRSGVRGVLATRSVYRQARTDGYAGPPSYASGSLWSGAGPVRASVREIVIMRLFLGIILGVLITIGGAYIADSTMVGTPPPGATVAPDQRPMVNWDVVSKNFN